jgi:hypothetical protein
MHKSLTPYASALNCTAGQIRRYIQAGLIPSARLVQGGKGRPQWTIRDTSAEAISALRERLKGVRPTRRARWRLPVFQEPVKHRQIEVKQGRAYAVSEILLWNPTFRERDRDWISVAYDVVYRFALLRHGLTVHELRCPPTHSDFGMNRMNPNHARLVRKFDNTLRRLTVALIAPPDTQRWRLVRTIINSAFESKELNQAAELLASYHRQHGVVITYVTLGRVMGISKSALYRRYDRKKIRAALTRSRRLVVVSPEGFQPKNAREKDGAPVDRKSLTPAQLERQVRKDAQDDEDWIASQFERGPWNRLLPEKVT